MPPILVSFLVEQPFTDPHGFKVYADGQVESYRISRRVKDASGTYVTEYVTPGWYPLTHLNPDSLTRIEAAVAQVQPLPASIEAEEEGRAVITWQFGDHTLAFQWEPLPAAAQPFLDLSQLIGDTVLHSMI